MTQPSDRQNAEARSLWQMTATMPDFPRLSGEERADVCVIGGGIAGLTTAYLLGRAGKSVVLLEDGELASGMTSLTTAHLASAIDDRFVEIERIHGERGARLAAESHATAIDRIEEIVAREGLACDFQRVDGYLFLAPDSERDLLDRELDAARRAGLRVEKASRAPIDSFDTGTCLRFAGQGQFHPLAYLSGVARAFVRGGGRVFTHSHATEIDGGPPALVRTQAGAVRASFVVVATNSPIVDRVAIHTKQVAHITYALAAPIPVSAVPAALYWDTAEPYHYVRVHRLTEGDGQQMLIVGGEDHPTGRADDIESRHARLERWARERFPLLGPVLFRWAGQVMESIDGLGFIGRNPLDSDNVYVATGDSGMGMTHGTIAGMLITDLIMGRPNAWAELYDPARKPLRAAVEYAKDAMAMTAQYADWMTPGDVGSVEEIAPGTGAIIRRGLSKVAAYRDEHGTLHERSAVCTHLGCIVQWNAAARTWDCPCHGSRFDRMGAVINGPANRALAPVANHSEPRELASRDAPPPTP